MAETQDILIPMGFASAANTPLQVCSAIRSERFLRGGDKRLEIVAVDEIALGQKNRHGCAGHYRVAGASPAGLALAQSSPEDAEARAMRVAQRIRGLLKEELAEYGGGEAFLKWMRSEDGEHA